MSYASQQFAGSNLNLKLICGDIDFFFFFLIVVCNVNINTTVLLNIQGYFEVARSS